VAKLGDSLSKTDERPHHLERAIGARLQNPGAGIRKEEEES